MTAFLVVYALTAVIALLAGIEQATSPKFRNQPVGRRILIPVAVAAAWPLALIIGAVHTGKTR